MILKEVFSEMPPKRRRSTLNEGKEDDEEYRNKRKKNNEAVKKSRFKSKLKTQETFSRVNKLKAENQMLEEKVNSLTKELQFLKELFLAHASNVKNPKFEGIDLETLLADIPDEDNDKK